MKKTTKTKMGPLGTPLGNPLGFFNSLKAKRSAAPKQTLRKAPDGISVRNIYAGPITEADSKILDRNYPSTVSPSIPYAPKKPKMGYGSEELYRNNENIDRKMYENYLRSPGSSVANKKIGRGLSDFGTPFGLYNDQSINYRMNEMNNIDWNSEEGAFAKKIIDRDYKETKPRQKKGGPVKRKKK